MTTKRYFAVNRFEGCGHRHKTRTAAKRCFKRLSNDMGRKQVLVCRPLYRHIRQQIQKEGRP